MRFFYIIALCLWMSSGSIYRTQDADLKFDLLTLHNGKTSKVVMHQVTSDYVVFHYLNETAEEKLSKYAVEKIIYSNGREAEITQKIIVKSKKDWKKVVIVDDEDKLIGLQRKLEIQTSANIYSIRSAGTHDVRAEEELKKQVAKAACPFVFLSQSKTQVITTIKKGVVYCYE